MPRIRSIKPEFWTDDKVGLLSFVGRLLFIGLWNLADDTGVLEDSPLQLKAQLFPYDGVSRDDVEAQLGTLARLGMVVRYSSQNKKLLWIRHFSNHQSPQHGYYRYKDSPPPGFHFERNRFVPSVTDKSVSAPHLVREPSVSLPRTLTDHSVLEEEMEEERGREQELEKETSPTPEGVGAPARESKAANAEIGQNDSTTTSEGSILPHQEGPDGPSEPSRKGPGGDEEVLDQLEALWGHKLMNRRREGAAIRHALANGYTADQIVACWRATQASHKWSGKWMPLAFLVEDLGDFIEGGGQPLRKWGGVVGQHPDEPDRKEYLRRYGHMAVPPVEPDGEEGA